MLTVRGLKKRFGNTDALRSVDLHVEEGEIHGLVGLNGSGKTTLLNVLFGSAVISATGGYGGEVLLNERPVYLSSPARAIGCGIGMVHQEFALIPSMTVTENVTIRRERVFAPTAILGRDLALMNAPANRRRASSVLERLGVRLDPSLRVMDLTVNMRQFVEIAREIDRDDLRVLLLDEPTSALNYGEVQALFASLRSLASRGVSLIFVSHRLEEITTLCHAVTVLRDGEVAGCFTGPAYDVDALAECMIGHHVTRAQRQGASRKGSEALRLEGFSVDMPGERINGIDLTVSRGEILGLAGPSGHGRPAFGYGIMGMYPTSGRVFVDRDHIAPLNALAMISRGLFFIPEDRRAAGLLTDHSIMENIVFAAMQCKGAFLNTFPFRPLALEDRRHAHRFAEECVERFGIRCTGVHQKVSELSGGNQQKVCIARALAMNPGILMVSEPTRGVDIAAKETILHIFLDLHRGAGTTLVISSSELDELMRMCDRIAVIHEGRIFDVLDAEATETEFALAFSGERRVHG
ncbi:MAG TPA: sugar ABC transporter ATP-binding protein [Deltaproteobacteria bacterium]|nr:sugar ABC transporter ATP-binding protein [Deltaproteobacteria bacterium]HQI81464.1 sugar ABC transporter ATP-binding protein [Deltaproteobacteria bacterium]